MRNKFFTQTLHLNNDEKATHFHSIIGTTKNTPRKRENSLFDQHKTVPVHSKSDMSNHRRTQSIECCQEPQFESPCKRKFIDLIQKRMKITIPTMNTEHTNLLITPQQQLIRYHTKEKDDKQSKSYRLKVRGDADEKQLLEWLEYRIVQGYNTNFLPYLKHRPPKQSSYIQSIKNYKYIK